MCVSLCEGVFLHFQWVHNVNNNESQNLWLKLYKQRFISTRQTPCQTNAEDWLSLNWLGETVGKKMCLNLMVGTQLKTWRDLFQCFFSADFTDQAAKNTFFFFGTKTDLCISTKRSKLQSSAFLMRARDQRPDDAVTVQNCSLTKHTRAHSQML